MAMIVHHYPANTAALWKIHIWQAVWDGNNVWGLAGTSSATIDFQLPDTPDSRKLQFRFHSISRSTGLDTWESGDFTRRLRLISPTAVWTFESSPRILYQNPFPSGVAFKTGDVLTFQAITQKAFRGGRLYVWNPYRPDVPSAYFGESARDDEKAVSTFRVTLTSWMTAGFNLKLMQPGKNDQPSVWEPDSSNRVWRPYDGNLLWLKSGQCDLREAPLQLTPIALEVLYGSNLPNPPEIKLKDTVEGSIFPLPSSSVTQYSESSLFNVAAYRVPIYPDASYTVKCMDLENPPIERPFPADPTVLNAVSRFVLGAGAWVNAFPTVRSVPFAIKPQSNSSFSGGLGVQISLGNGPFYQHVSATRQDDGTYRAEADVAQNTTTAIDMIPTVGEEPRPYAWIDTSRYFTPTANTTTLYTTEGVYGICERGPTQFANPANRPALMQAAFGAVATSGIFAAREMPQGATIMGKDVYFVVHAPHATCATLIAVDDPGAGKPLRKEIPMSLTDDTFYWWCKLPVAQVPPGTRYRFLLNDDVEVIDPAARAVVDGGSLKTSVGEDPADPSTSW
jgi:hypothetical protein